MCRENARGSRGGAGRIADENRFTLYEYFITDKVGHAQDMDARQSRAAKTWHCLIRELLARVDLNRTSVILTSDHGNIEDLILAQSHAE